METDIARSMDFGNHSRIQNSFQEAPSDQADTGLHLHGNGEENAVCRDRKAAGKAGDKFNRGQRWFHKQRISCSEEGGPMEIDYESKGLEHVHNARTFQDGRHTISEGSPEQRRLHVQTGFERRVSVSPNQRRSPKVPPISMGRNSVSLQSPTIWVGNRTSGVHEALEACSGSPSSQRTETGGIFGRHANCRDEQGRNRECVQTDQAAFGRAWFRDQPREITTTGNPVYRVPGLHGQLPLDVLQATEGQGERDQEQVQTGLTGENVTDTPIGSDHRCVDFNSPCNAASTPTLSRSPSTKNPRTSPPPLIRVEGDIGGAEYEGFELVDQQLGDHQWETDSYGITTDDDRIGCLQYRLGSVLEQPDDGRPLVVRGISAPHQRQGAVGCVSSTSNLCWKQERNTCSPEIGQHA